MNSFEKLKTKLAELFQLDQADLDFGNGSLRCDIHEIFVAS